MQPDMKLLTSAGNKQGACYKAGYNLYTPEAIRLDIYKAWNLSKNQSEYLHKTFGFRVSAIYPTTVGQSL